MPKNELTEIQPWLENQLSKYFYIQREYWIRNTRKRADFILTCKASGQKYGVECKASDVKKGTEVFEWISQAKEYSDLMGIPFFVFPHIQERIFCEAKINGSESHSTLVQHNNVSTFLGGYGVGELHVQKRGVPPMKPSKYYNWFRFIFGGYVLWDNSNVYNPHCNYKIDARTKHYNKRMKTIKESRNA